MQKAILSKKLFDMLVRHPLPFFTVMGKLGFDGKRFIWAPATDEDARFARDAKFVLDGLRWSTRNVHKAARLRRYADESAEKIFKKHFITKFAPPEQILYPDHLQPKVFQIESAWHVLTRSPAYVADEQGLGKTITSILCMNTVRGRVLVICPPFLKYNWADELYKWLTDKLGFDGPMRTLGVVTSAESINELVDRDIIILPDSLLYSGVVQHVMKKQKFEWLFVDEAHRYKTPNSERTVSLIGDDADEKDYFTFVSIANRVVYLSGTPIPNGRPIELYPILARTSLEAIKHRTSLEYGKVFCAGKQITRMEGKRAIAHWDFSGSSNLRKLRRELHAEFMIRHLKKNVLDELPPKTRKLVFLDAPEKLVKFEKEMLGKVTLKTVLANETVNLGDIARYQKEVGLAKLPQAIEYIKELLENSPDKLVVFAHHVDVVEGLYKALSAFWPLLIRGGMNASLKAERVRLFQNQKKYRVIFGNIDAMGVGVTLTKAPGVIVVEPSWVPGANEQAEDRVHRMTQDKNVYIRYLVMRGTLDEYKLRSVLSKSKNVSEVMG